MIHPPSLRRRRNLRPDSPLPAARPHPVPLRPPRLPPRSQVTVSIAWHRRCSCRCHRHDEHCWHPLLVLLTLLLLSPPPVFLVLPVFALLEQWYPVVPPQPPSPPPRLVGPSCQRVPRKERPLAFLWFFAAPYPRQTRPSRHWCSPRALVDRGTLLPSPRKCLVPAWDTGTTRQRVRCLGPV